MKLSRNPMATFAVIAGATLVATAAVSATLAATGGETTGREAIVIVVVGVVALAVIWAAYWWVRRTQAREHEEFMAMLDAPMQPSRLRTWHPRAGKDDGKVDR